jgi:hypothetical protein
MSTIPLDRPPAREAGGELLVLAQWEEFTSWLLTRTGKWPKSARFTLTQRLENHALDVTEMLVSARYEPRDRAGTLRAVNLLLERMRFLFRLALHSETVAPRIFETAMRHVDEAGRMIHGWRQGIAAKQSEVSA